MENDFDPVPGGIPKMIRKYVTVAIASFLFLAFSAHQAVAGPGNSKGKGKGVKSKITLNATLAPAEGSLSTGRIRRKTEKRGQKIRHDRLHGRVRVPLPSTLPALGTEEEAALADVRVVFLRLGVPYAECTLQPNIDDDTAEGGSLSAVYKLNLEKLPNKRATRARKGNCDIDLLTEGVQSGIPDAQADDTLSIQHFVDGIGTQFLTGEF